MAKEIKIIQVCFNVLDEHQRALYEYACSFPNKSSFAKRLMQRDYDASKSHVIMSSSVVQQQDIGFSVDGFI